MNSSKATRKYERLLFKGIPEQPEQAYERDQNSNVSLRVTGRAQSPSNYDSDETEVLGYMTYDFQSQKEIFTPSMPAKVQDRSK